MTNSVSVENGKIHLEFQDEKGNWHKDSYPYTQEEDSISFEWDMKCHCPRITMGVLSAMAVFFGTTDIDVTEDSIYVEGCPTCGDFWAGHDVKIRNITAGLPYYDHIPKKIIYEFGTTRAINFQNIAHRVESELHDADESWQTLGDRLGVIIFRILTENFTLEEISQFYSGISFNISHERLEKIARNAITRAIKNELKWNHKWKKLVNKGRNPKIDEITSAENNVKFTTEILNKWLSK